MSESPWKKGRKIFIDFEGKLKNFIKCEVIEVSGWDCVKIIREDNNEILNIGSAFFHLHLPSFSKLTEDRKDKYVYVK